MIQPRVILILWNAEEAGKRAERLRGAGYKVDCHTDPRGANPAALQKKPPDAFIIDLRRLPSHGRALGVWLRQQKATRGVPIVFVEGDAEKTRRVRELLPDAAFTGWSRIRGALHRAILRAPEKPAVPGTMDSYSGTPLPKKLGIRAGAVVALLGAPEGFDATLGALPERVKLRRQARGLSGVVLLFVKSGADLERRFPAAARAMADGGRLWIVWPKKSSQSAADLTLNRVRAFGLKKSFVDYKISSIDETWSGLCFARRSSRKRELRKR